MFGRRTLSSFDHAHSIVERREPQQENGRFDEGEGHETGCDIPIVQGCHGTKQGPCQPINGRLCQHQRYSIQRTAARNANQTTVSVPPTDRRARAHSTNHNISTTNSACERDNNDASTCFVISHTHQRAWTRETLATYVVRTKVMGAWGHKRRAAGRTNK